MSALLAIWLGVPALVVAAYAYCAAHDAVRAAIAWYKGLRPVLAPRLVLVAPMLVAPMRSTLTWCLEATISTLAVVVETMTVVAKCVIPDPDYSD